MDTIAVEQTLISILYVLPVIFIIVVAIIIARWSMGTLPDQIEQREAQRKREEEQRRK